MSTVAYVALWIFVFSLPWEGTVVIPGFGVIPKLVGIIAAGLALMSVVVLGRLRKLQGFHIAAILFVTTAGVTLWVFYPQERLPAKFWTYVQLVLVIWIVWELARSPRQVIGLLTAYVLGAHVAAIGTIMLYVREGGVLFRFAAGGVDPNDLAMNMVLAIPMAWYLGLIYRRPLLRWACRAYLPIGLVALGLTGSRGGMIATVVALSIVPLTLTRLSPAKLVAGILLVIISGWLVVSFTPDTLVERLATTGTEVEGGRFGGRFKLWRAGLIVFVQRPFLGWGTSSFKPAITPMMGPMAQVAHNSFISVLVEQGLIGLLLYLSMFVTVFRSLRNLPVLEKRFAFILFGTLVVAMLPLTWEDRKAVWFVLAVLLGLGRAGMTRLAHAVPQPWMPRGRPIPGSPPPLRGAPVTTRDRNPGFRLRRDA
jgi:O-antigen ligase